MTEKLMSQRHEQLAKALKLAGDSDIDEVLAILNGLLADRCRSGEWETPITEIIGQLQGLVVDEANHRTGTIWALEVDLADGHLVEVFAGMTTLGTWTAICAPTLDRECWSGPERTHIEDAIEDGRRHHPGHEPAVLM